MALLLCKECYATVSSRANNCPRCGAPVHPNLMDACLDAAAGISALLVVGLVLTYCLFPEVRLPLIHWATSVLGTVVR